MGAFEEALEAGHVGRREHVGASADLLTVSNEAVELVGMVDGLNRYRFRNDTEVLAAWDSVSKVRAFRPRGELLVEETPSTPAVKDLLQTGGDAVAPAA